MEILFINIKELIQVRTEDRSFVSGAEMQNLPTLRNAFLLVREGRIVDFGEMKDCPDITIANIVNATGKMILPAWCDSHSHLVYAGNREGEFIDRINGMSYEEIANKGGGILNSAKKLQEISEEELYKQSKVRLKEVMQMGTGALEIKSGYGLTREAELKMLKVIKRLKVNFPIEIKATFLAAHAIPEAYKTDKAAFLKLMAEEVMPIIAKEKLADYVDVFCEKGYFSVEDTAYILAAGQKHGLKSKIHVNQFNAIGGVQAGVKFNALSVDHLEVMRKEDIQALKNTSTMPVALPGCSYFLGIPYTPGREIIEAGLPLALASDYNPGSAPSGNMNFVVATACIKMKLTPEEAINAATINGAYAMGLEKEVGSITKGKMANLILTKEINSYGVLPYSFGTNNIDKVYLKGKEV
ncbi:imidazolonepropionase [Portibacter lacus]|uniref:Imidazolonepropionase n=1 Tax=Portibacter lacus TaxID=1099794 RepID=A0AA37SR14_9BACT|nr:imidazolonepropionase [Portibacter lacus]GLR19103.1 imidazolonepropionase [Portibacter lacus]